MRTALLLLALSLCAYAADKKGAAGQINTFGPGATAVSRSVEDKLRERVSVKDYGAKGDAHAETDNAIVSGDKTFTNTYPKFAASDVGKTIYVSGAGVSGADLVTTIASFTSNASIELTDAAATTVTGAQAVWGSDDTAAFNAALAAATTSRRAMFVPDGNYILTDQIYAAYDPHWGNYGADLVGAGSKSTFLYFPSTFNLTRTGVIHGLGEQTISGLTLSFSQPDTATRGNLIAYPPAIYCATGCSAWKLKDLRFYRASTAIKCAAGCPGMTIDDVNMSAFTEGIFIDQTYDVVKLSNIHYWIGFGLTANQQAIVATSPSAGFRRHQYTTAGRPACDSTPIP